MIKMDGLAVIIPLSQQVSMSSKLQLVCILIVNLCMVLNFDLQ